MKRKLLIFVAILFAFLIVPTYLRNALGSSGTAASYTASCGREATDVWTIDCIFPLVDNFIFWGIFVASDIAVIIIIIAGIRFITSGGDPKKLDQAKKAFAYAILALVLMYLAFFIINVIGYVTGVSCINVSPTQIFSFTSCDMPPTP